MKSIVDELKTVPVKKEVNTTIEYNCQDADQENEIFETVRDILFNQLDDFSKITYETDPAAHIVKVEVKSHE